MPSKSKLSIFWLQGVSCNGNAHSFINYNNLEALLEKFEFYFHPILPSKYTLKEMATCKHKVDILLVEGCYNKTLQRGGESFGTLFAHYGTFAKHILAVGSCASFGGLLQQSDAKNNSGLAYNKETKKANPVADMDKLINIPGCPIHPEWLGFVLEMLYYGKELLLDELQRPLELYAPLAHHGCDRNEYFEWKVDSKSFGTKEGCLFYEQGCRGPLTHSSCNKILWNDVNSKTRAGTPCFGCTEATFPTTNLFETKTNMSIPEEAPLGVSKRAYLTLTGIAKTFHIKRLEGKLIDYKKTHRKD